MGAARRFRPVFNVQRLVADLAIRGWNDSDLARAAGVSSPTVTRFKRGEYQTAKTAELFARALGYSTRRYFSHVEEVA
jgi:transcriptional regulator with XRE-family HTH domain